MTEQQKKLAAGGGFVLLAALILFYELHDSSSPAAPPPAVVTTVGSGASGGSAARRVSTAAADLDPALHFGSMREAESLTYSGTGRNIFSATPAAPVALPTPIAQARPLNTPVVQAPTGPPPPPPIDLKFFGTATGTARGRQAFLLRGDDVFLASVGDIVQRRYKVVSIAANSILVEDLADNHQQTLPLLTNY